MKVQVVTDSTSDIPQDLANELGIRVVPIYVRFGDKTYRDGVDIRSDEFYSMLASLPFHPSISQPNPEDFTSAYKEYFDTTEGIMSIHISSKISGTYNSAMIAQKIIKSRCPIEVIDSKFNSAGLGLVVIAAARLAQSGTSLTIFQSELPLVLEAIRYGDRTLFEQNPQLDNTLVLIHFKSTVSQFDNVENWGTMADYR